MPKSAKTEILIYKSYLVCINGTFLIKVRGGFFSLNKPSSSIAFMVVCFALLMRDLQYISLTQTKVESFEVKRQECY